MAQKSIPTCVSIWRTHLQSLMLIDKTLVNESMRTEGGAAISSKSELIDFLEFQVEILDLEF